MENLLSRKVLTIIITPHLGFGDMTYKEAYDSSFNQKLEPTHYTTCLAIARGIWGMSEEKNNHQLDLEIQKELVKKIMVWFKIIQKKIKVKNIYSAYFLKEAHFTQPVKKTIFHLKLILTAAILKSVLAHAPLVGVAFLCTSYNTPSVMQTRTQII